MDAKVEITGKGKDRRVRIVGSPQAFQWLLTAANNAQNGYTGNECALDDGGVLELVPAEPRPDQAVGSKTLHAKRG